MDDFRNHVWEDTSFDSDEANRRPQVTDSVTSSDDTLRDAAGAGIVTSGVLSSIKICSRVWTLGESISSMGTTAVCKSKLRDSFGDAQCKECEEHNARSAEAHKSAATANTSVFAEAWESAPTAYKRRTARSAEARQSAATAIEEHNARRSERPVRVGNLHCDSAATANDEQYCKEC